jgi:hypothetical protein
MTHSLVHEAIDFLTGNCGACPPTLVMRTGTARPPVKATPTRYASGPATNRQPGRAAIGKGFTGLPDQPAILAAGVGAARAGPRASARVDPAPNRGGTDEHVCRPASQLAAPAIGRREAPRRKTLVEGLQGFSSANALRDNGFLEVSEKR